MVQQSKAITAKKKYFFAYLDKIVRMTMGSLANVSRLPIDGSSQWQTDIFLDEF
ncbi:MAG: hypothetical protein IPP79_18890 [Chitinophagaceae bacterium]|nr:hypothetical protein [Chitinophagaceae bacterium]